MWLLFIGLSLAAIAIALTRLVARRRRRVARWRVSLPRTDRPEFEEVVRLLGAWGRVLEPEHWYLRLLFGPAHFGLEARVRPVDTVVGNGSGRWDVEVDVVCTPQAVAAMDAHLANCYPNARIGYAFDETPVPDGRCPVSTRRMLRLRKRRDHVLPAADAGEGHVPSRVDAALRAARVGSGVTTIQFRLTPASRLCEWQVQRRVRRFERDLESERRQRGLFAGPGLAGSPSARRELDAMIDTRHTGLFRGEVWVFGDDARAVDNAAVALQVAGGENPLGRRRVANPLHRRRVQDALPGFLSTDTYSAMELAALWGLPSDLTHPDITRNAVPRLAPPPAVCVTPTGRGIGRVVGGQLRIRPEERRLGIQISGLQGVGKSSVMLSLFEEAARDPEQAVILFDPKGRDLATAALGLVPPEREGVYYLDLRNPMFGVNPLEASGEQESRISALIQGLVDMNDEGAIRTSSERYLRFAAEGASAIAKQNGIRPSIWLVSALLDPGRENLHRIASYACQSEGLFGAAQFYWKELPDQLSRATSPTVQKLDAPKNKLQALLSGTVDAVLHHPVQLSLETLIAERGVLIVDAGPGEVGEHNRHKVLQMLFRLVFAAVQRQQALPESRRTRVGLLIDEAHLVLTEAFHDMAATGRSAGVELVAAFQGSEQFVSPKVLLAVDDLLRNALIFAATREDAMRGQDMVSPTVFGQLRPDAESRASVRVPADVFRYLPPYTAVASLTCGNERQPPFTLVTNPPASDPDVARRHLKRLATMEFPGGRPHHPADLGDLIGDIERLTRSGDPARSPRRSAPPEATGVAENEPLDIPSHQPDTAEQLPAGESAPCGAQEPDPDRTRELHAESTLPAATGSQVASSSTRIRIGAPDSYTEVDIDPVIPTRAPFDRTLKKSDWGRVEQDDVQMVRLLTKTNWALGPQIAEWLGKSERRTSNVIKRAGERGWIARYQIKNNDGRWRYVYTLTMTGFKAGGEYLEQLAGSFGRPDREWTELKEIHAPIVHDLRMGAWALAFNRHAGASILRAWHGPKSTVAKPRVPTRGGQNGRRSLKVHEIDLPYGQLLQGADHFRDIRADSVLDVRLGPDGHGGRIRQDWFLELNNAQSPGRNAGKFKAYDAFLSGWGREHPRYDPRNDRPRSASVIYICRDEPQMRAMMRVADASMTARLTTTRKPTEWEYPGRERSYFVAELAMHEGDFSAWQLPRLPPNQRREVGLDAKPVFEKAALVDPAIEQRTG